MDKSSPGTMVYVHSPLIQYSSSGSYFTSYAVSLKSNHPCFTHAYSQTRRRYSEFRHLRRLLVKHHPTIKPPTLPSKNFFQRFNDSLIEERKVGLQDFLEKVLEIPVYLSDKSLHLFLQSSCSMSQVDEQCIGDIPAPQLMDWEPCCSENGSVASSDGSHKNESMPHSQPITSSAEDFQNRILEEVYFPTRYSQSASCPLPTRNREPYAIPRTQSLQSIARNRNSLVKDRTVSNFLEIPRRQSSLDSSPSSSLSSMDTNGFSTAEDHTRKVSFNENVTVAVVYNQLWNIAIKRIKSNT